MEITNEAKFIIGGLVATVLIIIGGAYWAGRNTTTQGEAVEDQGRLVQSDSPVLGPDDAVVTVVEFGDFECPACGALHPILKSIKETYKDKPVRFVYRQFPLPQHSHAQLAAEASLAAQEQGKFWEYHDMLFEHQQDLERDNLISYAQELGLDTEAFTAALTDGRFRGIVDRDKRDGTALRVDATPTLYINGVKYQQAFSAQEISAVIGEALGAQN